MENSNPFQAASNQEIYTQALQEWTGILNRLWDAFGKPINKQQFKVYKDSLGSVPLGILEHVVEETIKRHKYNSVPTLGEINDVLMDLHPNYENDNYVHTHPNRDAFLQHRPA